MSNTALALDEFTLEMRLHYLTTTLETLERLKTFENYFTELKLAIEDWVLEARSNSLVHFAALLEEIKLAVLTESFATKEDAKFVSGVLEEYLQTLKSFEDSPDLFEKCKLKLLGTLRESKQRYLQCVRDGHCFVVPVSNVIEIVSNKKVSPLPLVQTGILGLLGFRGQAIPVVNLRDYGFESINGKHAEKTYFVVCELKEAFFAIEVNSTEEVVELEASKFQKCSGTHLQSQVVDQFVLHDERSLMLLDIEKLVKYE